MFHLPIDRRSGLHWFFCCCRCRCSCTSSFRSLFLPSFSFLSFLFSSLSFSLFLLLMATHSSCSGRKKRQRTRSSRVLSDSYSFSSKEGLEHAAHCSNSSSSPSWLAVAMHHEEEEKAGELRGSCGFYKCDQIIQKKYEKNPNINKSSPSLIISSSLAPHTNPTRWTSVGSSQRLVES
jgi:hypothetical protein